MKVVLPAERRSLQSWFLLHILCVNASSSDEASIRISMLMTFLPSSLPRPKNISLSKVAKSSQLKFEGVLKV